MKQADLLVREMIEKIPILAWSCQPDGTADFLNQRWLDYTGLSTEAAVGWGWQAAIHSEDLGKLMDTWLRLLATGEPGEVEGRLRRFDGEHRWFLFRAIPIRDEEGRVVRWYGTNTDIEDRKWAETLLAGENRLLKIMAEDNSLSSILDALCRVVEELSAGTLCSILFLDSDGHRLRHAAAPAFRQAIRKRLMEASSAHARDRAERPPTAESQSSFPTSSRIPCGPTIAIWPQRMGCERVGPHRYFLQLEGCWAPSRYTHMNRVARARNSRR